MSKIVYKQGLRAPLGHTAPTPLSMDACTCPVCEQLLAAHRYANTLTEIERGRRAAVRSLHAKVGDTAALEVAVADAERAAEDVVTQIKRARAKVFVEASQKGATPNVAKRGARVTPPELARALAEARTVKREAVKKLTEHRVNLRTDPRIIVGEFEIGERAKELVKSARAYSGCYWGTYLMVERAHGASISSLPLYDGAAPNDPRFERFRGEGSIAVQIQHLATEPTFTVEQLLGDDRRVQIRPYGQAGRERTRLKRDENGRVVRGGPFVEVRRGNSIVRRQLSVRETVTMIDGAMLRLRIGSEGRAPIWAEWPMTEDRPLPKGAIVSWVTVTKRMIALREEWTVQFTLDTVEDVVRHEPEEERVVALNFGWRVIDNDLRVAYWRSKDGTHGDLIVPASLLSLRREADEVQSRRDREFDEARSKLVTWLEQTNGIPMWLVEAKKTLASWKSQARLVHLVKRWHAERFAGDGKAFAAVEKWRYHEHHLWEWEMSVRTTAVRSRDDLYRRWAKKLSESFEVLVIDGTFDVRQLAEHGPVDADANAPAASSNRQLVAPGRLREIISQGFTKRHRRVAKQPGIDITRTCQVCGLVEEFGAAKSVVRATPCSGCGATWDQDDNACIELLARYDQTCERERVAAERAASSEESSDETPKSDPAPKASKWDVAKRKKAEKIGRVADARKILDKEAEPNGAAP